MSDYISREQVIDALKETGIIQDNDLGHLVVDEINRIPTVDETEIIRKAFERVIERLEGEKERHDKDCSYWNEHSWKDELQFNECDMSRKKSECFEEAIEIVKEECGISE